MENLVSFVIGIENCILIFKRCRFCNNPLLIRESRILIYRLYMNIYGCKNIFYRIGLYISKSCREYLQKDFPFFCDKKQS